MVPKTVRPWATSRATTGPSGRAAEGLRRRCGRRGGLGESEGESERDAWNLASWTGF